MTELTDTEQNSADLSTQKQKWEQSIESSLKRFPERRQQFVTTSGIDVERLYTPVEVTEIDHARDIGFPGQYPFTRGVQPTMYRGRFWTMRQYAGYATAEESNER
jgi:methylmalonyl-CoA mutase, N-terminal domain